MSITTIIDADVVINSVGDSEAFEDILEYLAQNLGTWGNRQVLWDVTSFNFQSVGPQSIRSLISDGISLSEKRSGLKTAILVDSDLGYGMMRMLQILAEERFKTSLGLFRSKDQALEWLSD